MRSNVARWGILLLVIGASLGFAAPVHATTASPNDPAFKLQWNLQMIGAPSAWQVATGSGITIAIIDTGVDLTHEDLQSGKIVGDVTCVGAAGDSTKCKPGGQDDNGHGTHVAGIAAASTDNGIGVAGTAPDASILAVKVLESDGSGSGDDVAAGIRYAADHGASVINLSLGERTQSVFGPTFQKALDYAFDKGSIPIIAAGNNVVLPSGPITHAIVVGALNRTGLKATYSNIPSSQWAIAAPGGEPDDTSATCSSAPIGVLSTYFNNAYACVAGTSQAAPHVAGAIAVLRSTGLSPQHAIDTLLSTARPLPTTSIDGAGALDLAAAVGQPPTPPPPDTTPEPTTTPDGNGGGVVTTNPTETASSNFTPAGDLGGPTSTSPPVINMPSQRAAAAAPAPGRVIARSPSNDGLSPAVIVAAVLMTVAVGCAVGWFALRGSNLARRTPPPDR